MQFRLFNVRKSRLRWHKYTIVKYKRAKNKVKKKFQRFKNIQSIRSILPTPISAEMPHNIMFDTISKIRLNVIMICIGWMNVLEFLFLLQYVCFSFFVCRFSFSIFACMCLCMLKVRQAEMQILSFRTSPNQHHTQ